MNALRSTLAVLVTAATLGLGFAAESEGAPVLRFDNPIVDGGTLTHIAGGPVTGTDILFQNVIGEDTFANDGAILTCVGNCLLNFVTGNATQEGPNLWTFAGGGSFTLTGTLQDEDLNVIAAGTLLSGIWNDGVVVTTDTLQINLSGFGVDEKHPGLTDFYGIPDPTSFIFSNTEISGTLSEGGIRPNGSFLATVAEADIVNTYVGEPPAQVPAPAALGLVLLGVGLIATRRFLR